MSQRDESVGDLKKQLSETKEKLSAEEKKTKEMMQKNTGSEGLINDLNSVNKKLETELK